MELVAGDWMLWHVSGESGVKEGVPEGKVHLAIGLLLPNRGSHKD